MTLVHPVSEAAPVASDGLLVEGEDMGAAKLQGEKGVQWLPKGYLVAAATYLRCATVALTRNTDVFRRARGGTFGPRRGFQENGNTGIRECLGRLGVAEGPREIRKDSEPNDGCPRHHASEGSPS